MGPDGMFEHWPAAPVEPPAAPPELLLELPLELQAARPSAKTAPTTTGRDLWR
jgi:hypothetical protein